MKFNIKDYPGKYAMHCKTKEEAKDFCKFLDSIGRKWCRGGKYADVLNWDWYEKNTAYSFNDGTYADTSYYRDQHYTILKWEDFMNHTFTKADLKNWDIVQYRNGNTAIVNTDLGSLISKEGYNQLGCFRDDLTCCDHDFDIVAVRRPKVDAHCQLNAFEYSRGTLVYERQEVEEMTLEQVCKLLGKNIKIVK